MLERTKRGIDAFKVGRKTFLRQLPVAIYSSIKISKGITLMLQASFRYMWVFYCMFLLRICNDSYECETLHCKKNGNTVNYLYLPCFKIIFFHSTSLYNTWLHLYIATKVLVYVFDKTTGESSSSEKLTFIKTYEIKFTPQTPS